MTWDIAEALGLALCGYWLVTGVAALLRQRRRQQVLAGMKEKA